jgi:hypothetical protein
MSDHIVGMLVVLEPGATKTDMEEVRQTLRQLRGVSKLRVLSAPQSVPASQARDAALAWATTWDGR